MSSPEYFTALSSRFMIAPRRWSGSPMHFDGLGRRLHQPERALRRRDAAASRERDAFVGERAQIDPHLLERARGPSGRR